MGVRVTNTHALTQGDRMHYVGTQSWGPCSVTVVKPWGGQADPLYVVRPDGMGELATYVVAASELRPVPRPTLDKITDRSARMRVHPWILNARARERGVAVGAGVGAGERRGWLLARNDLDGLAAWFAHYAGR